MTKKRHPLATARFLQGLSQYDVARKMGISQSLISMIEMGHRLPTAAEAKKLARIVSGNADDLFPEVSDG